MALVIFQDGLFFHRRASKYNNKEYLVLLYETAVKITLFLYLAALLI